MSGLTEMGKKVTERCYGDTCCCHCRHQLRALSLDDLNWRGWGCVVFSRLSSKEEDQIVYVTENQHGECELSSPKKKEAL